MATRLARLNWALTALAGIVALGLGLRLWGINFGLPYTYAPDEAWHMSVWLAMIKNADLNPHWLGYPHLAFYVHGLVFLIYGWLGTLAGVFQSPVDLPYA